MKSMSSSLRGCLAVVVGFGLFLFSSGVIFSQYREPIYAYETPFISSVLVFNASTSTASDIKLKYHNATVAGQATPTVVPTPVTAFNLTLNSRGSRSIELNQLFLKANRTTGSGVLSSANALVGVVVQNPQYSPEVVAQPVANGPRGTAGSTLYLATFSKDTAAMTSIVAVQNVDTVPITITLQPYETDGDTIGSPQSRTNIPPGSSAYFDATQTAGGNYSGSAKITGTGKIFATVTELATNNYFAYSFEGSAGAETVYLPTVSCDAADVTSHIALRNLSSVDTIFTITYSNGNTNSETLEPHEKWSVDGCEATPSNNPSNFNGAATITGVPAGEELVAATMAVVVKSEKKSELTDMIEYRAAYTAVTTGARTLVLPYVRWAAAANWGAGPYHNRTYIMIQNVSSTKIEDPIYVHYIHANGTIAETYEINTDVEGNGVVATNPSIAGLTSFGYYSNHVYGGSVVIQGPEGSELAVVARTIKNVDPDGLDAYKAVAEDYVGIPIPDNAVSLPEPE